MDGRQWKVRLAGGSALVARHGGVVLLAEPEGDVQQHFLDDVLEVCRAAAEEHPGAPGKRLVRKVASLVSQADVDDVPSFGLLASLGEDVAAFLVGDVELEISTASGKDVVAGSDVSTWVDRIVRAPFDAVALTVSGAGDLDPRSDLGSGTVSAGGVVVTVAGAAPPAAAAPAAAPLAPTPEPAHAPEPLAEPTSAIPVPEDELPAPGQPLAATAPDPQTVAPVVPEPAPAGAAAPAGRATFQAVSLAAPPEQPAEPLPVAGQDTAQEAEEEPQIQGIMCSRRHFNDPTSVYCSACGISMVHQTHNLVWGRRPPLGVLVFDDGSVVPLNQDYVLGREPAGAMQVVDGSATPLEIDDPELKVSRVHARISLKEWNVRVVDASSANGTFVMKKGQEDWTRLTPEEPATIAPGTRISMGGRTMEFGSHHKA
jgi:hypothetical protein